MIEKSKSAFQAFYVEQENNEFVWNLLNRMSHSYFVILSYRDYIVKTLEYYKDKTNMPDKASQLVHDRIEELVNGEYKEFANKKWSLLAMTGPLKESIFLDEECFIKTLNVLTVQTGEVPIDI